ncbi:MAG TPA: polysaccharide deacetylase [Alphaproteobacteria bacterium]|nr:polysaccharide deacetylase [Alphaproteobacteria bacterium]
MIKNRIPWPKGARCAVSITWDMDADSGLNWYNRDTADNLIASQSYVRYGPLIAVPRIAEELARIEMRQTFFVPGWCIEKYPAQVDLLLEHGHEVALHGYLHERSNEMTPEDERYWLGRAVKAYAKHMGKRPRGWRAPSFAFSKYSLRYLIEEGFEYDSSLMGDDIPYALRDDRGSLLEFPTDWTLDDWPHYVHNRDFHYMMPISAPQRAMEVFRAEFDAAWQHGGLWISVWHPFVSGRLARFGAVLELIDYMKSKGGVWFAPLEDVCDHVKALMRDKLWQPRTETIPLYQSPIPEFSRT